MLSRLIEVVFSASDDGFIRYRRAAMGSFFAALAKIISIVTTFISVPLTLNFLGVERYGVWLAMNSFVALLSFADFGLGNGVLNSIAKAYGADDRLLIKKVVSSGLCSLSIVAAALWCLFAIFYHLISWQRVFNLQASVASDEVGLAIATYIGFFLLGLPIGLIQKIQMGLQKSYISNIWQCVSSIFTLICLLIAIYFEARLPWLISALAGAPVLINLLNAMIFFRLEARDIMPDVEFVSFEIMCEVTRVGATFFCYRLSQLLLLALTHY